MEDLTDDIKALTESLAKEKVVTSDDIKALMESPEMANSPFIHAMDQITRLYDEHRMLVIITHAYVELVVNAMVEQKCRNGKAIKEQKRDFTHSTKLTILNEAGVIDDHHYRLLNWLRKLRNDAAHEARFELTKQRLDVFTDPQWHKPERFFCLCIIFLIDLWKTYGEDVGCVFAPDLYETVTMPVLMTSRPAPKYRIGLKTDPATIEEPADD